MPAGAGARPSVSFGRSHRTVWAVRRNLHHREGNSSLSTPKRSGYSLFPMARHMVATDCAALVEEADDALTSLSPHEELLLRLRFGIGGRRQSVAVIALRFGLRAGDVRDLETRALTHLRRIAIAAESARQAQG